MGKGDELRVNEAASATSNRFQSPDQFPAAAAAGDSPSLDNTQLRKRQ
jgi:hypothetical protein